MISTTLTLVIGALLAAIVICLWIRVHLLEKDLEYVRELLLKEQSKTYSLQQQLSLEQIKRHHSVLLDAIVRATERKTL